VRKVVENLLAAAVGNVRGDEHEMEFAFAAAQRIAPDQKGARF